jgi:hypothetical protein
MVVLCGGLLRPSSWIQPRYGCEVFGAICLLWLSPSDGLRSSSRRRAVIRAVIDQQLVHFRGACGGALRCGGASTVDKCLAIETGLLAGFGL